MPDQTSESPTGGSRQGFQKNKSPNQKGLDMTNIPHGDGNSKGLVVRSFNAVDIGQRCKDGYLNATAMCKAAGKEWSNYFKSDSAKAFADELSRSLRIGRDLLIVSVGTGPNDQRGTWVHPQVGYHLAQWCSPAFAVKVTEWIADIREYGFTTVKGVKAEESAARDSLKRAKEVRLQLVASQKLAKTAGLEGSQAAIAASRWTEAMTGVNPLHTMGITTEMKSPVNAVDLPPRDLGKPFGLSAIRVNLLLEEAGYQKRPYGKWEPTEKGKAAGGRFADRERSNGTGSTQHLLWPSSMIVVISDLLGRAA